MTDLEALRCACGQTATREGEAHTPDGAIHRYSVCERPPWPRCSLEPACTTHDGHTGNCSTPITP